MSGLGVGVLASGAGTNLQAILDTVHGHDGISVRAVASNRSEAAALERAAAAGIPTRVFELPDPTARAERDSEMAAWLEQEGVGLVVLAGYMQLLTDAFLTRFPEAVINVHPALLPAFPGIDAIGQAIDHGVKVFGVTVHFVDDGVDSGPIIAQRAIEIPDATDPEQVHDALRPIEHELLPEAIRRFARGALRIDPDNPRHVIVSA